MSTIHSAEMKVLEEQELVRKEVNKKINQAGETRLHLAAKQPRPGYVKELLAMARPQMCAGKQMFITFRAMTQTSQTMADGHHSARPSAMESSITSRYSSRTVTST